MPAPETKTPLDALALVVAQEFRRWEGKTLIYDLDRVRDVHPDPEASNGLPAGWQAQVRLRNYQPSTDLVLVRREQGGWVIVRYEHDLVRSRVYWVDTTLGEMYEHVLDCIPTTDRERHHPGAALIGEWLRGVLTALFDTTDPTEEAEQTLFALTGRLTVAPRAAA